MVVGTLGIELAIVGAQSLKEKRRVLKGLKDRLRQRFNVSVAEVAHQDAWQRAGLGVAAVGNDRRFVNAVLSKVIDQVRAARGVSLVDYELDLF